MSDHSYKIGGLRFQECGEALRVRLPKIVDPGLDDGFGFMRWIDEGDAKVISEAAHKMWKLQLLK